MTAQDITFGGYETPYWAQQIVTSSGTVRSEVTQVLLNKSDGAMTVRLPSAGVQGRQMRVRNLSTGTLGAHTVSIDGGTVDGVNSSFTLPPLAEVLVFSVGSQSYRVSEVRRGYVEFPAAAGTLPAPAPGCGLDVQLTYAGGATTVALPAFGAGDVGSHIVIAQTSTQAHKVVSYAPPRINGTNGTITFGTQVGAAVDLLVNSTGTIYTRNLQGLVTAVS